MKVKFTSKLNSTLKCPPKNQIHLNIEVKAHIKAEIKIHIHIHLKNHTQVKIKIHIHITIASHIKIKQTPT